MATEPTWDYFKLLERVIDDGIAEARVAYRDPNKRDGAVAGFERCRGKTPEEILAIYRDAAKSCDLARRAPVKDDEGIRAYWELRHTELHIEWVLNVLSFALMQNGMTSPLLPHQPTARAAFKYAEIVGVRTGGPQ